MTKPSSQSPGLGFVVPGVRGGAFIWSAPAERSGDGALATPGGGRNPSVGWSSKADPEQEVIMNGEWRSLLHPFAFA
jgi:hypothetical protein